MKSGLLATLILLGCLGLNNLSTQAAAGPASPKAAGIPTVPPSVILQPIFRIKSAAPGERFARPGQFEFEKWKAEVDGVAFRAVVTNDWPSGLVPLFGVEKTNRFELRRRPARGVENSSEPLFFAVPPDDEPDAVKICGRWDCSATRADGSKPFLGWELSSDDHLLSGRFDQNTDYRFGFITGGTFQENRFELNVEYIMDGYHLTGLWRDRTLTGQWTRTDGSESGKWTAQRPGAIVTIPEPDRLLALYEWRRADGAVRYGLGGTSLAEDWQRGTQPLCRVWTTEP